MIEASWKAGKKLLIYVKLPKKDVNMMINDNSDKEPVPQLSRNLANIDSSGSISVDGPE